MNRCKQASLAMGMIIGGLLLTGCVSDRQVVSQAADVHTGLKPAVMSDSHRYKDAGLSGSAVAEVWNRFLKAPAKMGWSRPWALYVLAKWCEVNEVTA